MTNKYILDGKKAVPCNDLMAWADWFETADRHVAQEAVGDIQVSTVFLGLNYRWGSGEPLLFETMIFGGPDDGYQTRCSTWEEAVAMHAKALRLARSRTAAEQPRAENLDSIG